MIQTRYYTDSSSLRWQNSGLFNYFKYYAHCLLNLTILNSSLLSQFLNLLA